MACRFGQMPLFGGLLRRARLGGMLSVARFLLALLRIMQLVTLAILSWRQTFTRRLMRLSRAGAALAVIAPLSMCLAWRARCLGGKMGGRNEAVYFNYRDLAFDQPLD